MNFYKSLFILLTCGILLTSCDNDVTPRDQYIGEWVIQDLSGDGSLTEGTTGLTMDVSIKLEHSDHTISINDNETLYSEGEVNGKLVLFMNGEFLASETMNILSESTEYDWSLNGNNGFVCGELGEIEFDGDNLRMKIDINDIPEIALDMRRNNIAGNLMMEFLYVRQ